MLNILKYTFLIAIALLIYGCQCSGQEESVLPNRQKQEDRIKATRDFLQKERASIEAYMKDNQLEMQPSGTGLFYKVLKDSVAGKNASSSDRVEIEYRISNMYGKVYYSSEESGTRTFTIDREDVEIGLHEAVKFLGLGDKGLFILPSHLAFGVAGDQKRIPPVTPLVYEIEIINIQKSKS